ncbi:MAG: glycoside hydrolase family 3 C-terminal domain-containing protein [Lachnospiraceae bacterium]|nr:glycoside hydrolase family 3 C-terminal domain-containing protein [Lachnospiraceae bacterium]
MQEKQIREIISKMTLEEKVALISSDGPCALYELKEHGVPSVNFADGATGVNASHISLDFLMLMQKMAAQRAASDNQGGEQKRPAGMSNPMGYVQELVQMEPEAAKEAAAENPLGQGFLRFLEGRRNPAGKIVSFPSGVNIGATFNEKLANEIGIAIGKEMRASHLDVVLGPNVDVARDPLGGRNYEMYSEDAIHVGKTAVAVINGIQSTGTAVCAKHFIANNQETRRQTKNTHVSTRTLREIYAKGFEKSVKNANLKSVMSAYNAVNGQFSSYNKTILTDWLKDEWGFDGVVVSDWGAVTGNTDQSLSAGLDLVLHGPLPYDTSDVAEGIEKGTLSMERLDDAVYRIISLVYWLKENQEAYKFDFNLDEILDKAYETIVDGTVLLKNEDVLPLDTSAKVAFGGSRADNTLECGGGSTFISTSLHSNVVDSAKELGVNVCDNQDDADTFIFVAGAEGGENADRKDMFLDTADQKEITEALKSAKARGKKTVVVLNVAGPIDMTDWKEYADAILVIFIPGCMGGKACADVIFGKANPAGRLPITFPNRIEESIAYPYVVGEHDDVYYSEGVFVGYRYYDAKDASVAYPFGYGLSYTTFTSKLVSIPSSWDIRKNKTIDIEVEVTNTGKCAGSEVIQVYAGYNNDRFPMPKKYLLGYGKVALEAGETKVITITLDSEDLCVYDPERGPVTPIGTYDISIGTNVNDIFTKIKIDIEGDNPYRLDEHSSFGEILDNPEAYKILKEEIPQFFNIPERYFQNMRNEKMGNLLSQQLIHTIPNANQLKEIMDNFFAKIGEL